MVLNGKSSQEYPVNAVVPQGSILLFFYYTLMTFLMMLSVILLSMLMILRSVLSVMRHLISGKNLNLIYETLDWGKKWLNDFNAGKTQLVLFDQSNNFGSIDVKMNGSVLEEKSSFKILGLTFTYKLDWDSTVYILLKLLSRKLYP